MRTYPTARAYAMVRTDTYGATISMALVNLVKIAASTTGTGAITLGAAVAGYRGVSALVNGQVYSYSIQQEASWEYGRGTFVAADNTLIRSPLGSSDGGTAISLQPNAAVAFVALAEDILGGDGGADQQALDNEIARATAAEAALSLADVALSNRIDGLVPDATSVPALREAINITRDPWINLTQKILRGAFGTITYNHGVRNTVVPPTLIIASIGNSHMVGQGALNDSMIPGEQLRAAFAAVLPGWVVEHDNYGTPGSWTSQYEGQVNGFARTPDIVLVGDPMNDGTGNIFMGYEGFVGSGNTYGGYEGVLDQLFARLHNAGLAVVNLTGHQPHPSRSKANGRLSVTPEVLMVWPQSSLIAYYLTIKFTVDDQRISAYGVNAEGNLVPVDLFNAYGGQLFGVGQYLIEFNPNTGQTGTMHQALEVAADGSWVRVNGTIPADKNDGVTSIRQGNFDNETQVWPPFSQAIVQRDYSGTGALVDVSWRHWELAKACRRVALRNAVVTVDSDAIFGRHVLTSADYDTLYAQPVGDDYHSQAWYPMLAAPFKALARDVVNGTIPADHLYSQDA